MVVTARSGTRSATATLGNLPVRLASLAIERFLTVFTRFRRQMVWVNRVAGVLLVLVGLLLVTDYLTFLSTYLQRLTPEFLRSRL